ncbi:MAG: hypothetical protein WCH01_22410 [Methylococcaceae bacterium]
MPEDPKWRGSESDKVELINEIVAQETIISAAQKINDEAAIKKQAILKKYL